VEILQLFSSFLFVTTGLTTKWTTIITRTSSVVAGSIIIHVEFLANCSRNIIVTGFMFHYKQEVEEKLWLHLKGYRTNYRRYGLRPELRELYLRFLQKWDWSRKPLSNRILLW